MPYGVKLGPGILQRSIDNLPKDIPFVIVRLDNTLVSEKDNVEHLNNLSEVLKRLNEANVRYKAHSVNIWNLKLPTVDGWSQQKIQNHPQRICREFLRLLSLRKCQKSRPT